MSEPRSRSCTPHQPAMRQASAPQTATILQNANHTMAQLSIADNIFSNQNQTCVFTYDEFTRLTKDNCGSVWGAAYAYDVFGNMAKSTIAGSPGTWDNEGNPVTVDGNPLTYDALNRRVEYYSSSLGYVQYLWAPYDATRNLVIVAPAGPQLELPLPGGSQAIVGRSGVTGYRRANWQGSQVIDSTTSQTASIDAAFTPYGEHYAENGYLGFFGGNLSIYPFFMDGYAATWRLYHYDQGRWISPDPAGLSAVDPSNPQTWNGYAYVAGNPLGNVDPSGHDICADGSEASVCVTAPFPSPLDYWWFYVNGLGNQLQQFLSSGQTNSSSSIVLAAAKPTTKAPNSGLTKKQAACAADAAINGALSIFVPGYAAAKTIASFEGISLNLVGGLTGTSGFFSGGNPTLLQTASGLAGANEIYQQSRFAAAGGESALARLQDLTGRAGFGAQTAGRQGRLLSQLGTLESLESAASFASKANNIAAGISAGYDIYKCVTTP